MDYFFNESGREEFGYFPFDSLPFIRGKKDEVVASLVQLVGTH
jgi:hypothetical protein